MGQTPPPDGNFHLFFFFDPFPKYHILGTIRDKVEYSNADKAALTALFEEFGSAKFAYFESGRSGQSSLVVSLFCLLTTLVILVANRY